MLDFVEQLFQRHDDHNQVSSRAQCKPTLKRAPKKSGVAYDEFLISTLEKEHELLIENFGKVIKHGFIARDFKFLCKQLDEFKVLFQNHVLKENVKFFCYLEQSQKNKRKRLKSIRKFRKEVNCCTNDVMNFCKKYEQPLETLFLEESFRNEYQNIAQKLFHRVQLVENEMYSLYAHH